MQIAYIKKPHSEHVINISKSKTKLMQFTQRFNKGKELRDKERLKPALQQTLSRLVYLLAKHYLNNNTNFFLRKENIHGELLSKNDIALPHAKSYIANYNQEDGNEFKNLSVATVRNHLNRLQYLGLITQVKAQSKTLLLIHPELIAFNDNFDHLNDHFNEYFDYPLENLITENKAIQENKVENLHPMYPNLETLNSITVSNVDNSKDSSNNNLENSYLDTRKAEKNCVSSEKQKEKVAPKRKSKREQYIQQAIIRLWIWIEANLYKGNYEFIAESQKDIALEYLEQCFEKSSKPAITVYSELKTRLMMWKRWKNIKFTPLPGAFFVHGNQNGFDKTENWVREKAYQQQKNKAIAKAKNHFRKYERVMADDTLDFHAKMKKIKALQWSMTQMQHKHPFIYKTYNQLVNEYNYGKQKTA